MEIIYVRVIETIIVFALFVLLRLISKRLIDKTMTDKLIQKSRGDMIKKMLNFTMLIIVLTIILIIWGVKQSELGVFVGSVLTVIGVALFAQWSILSNITASIIIFFNHPVKIGDSIFIMEAKEYEVEGRVKNIGIFFVTIETKDFQEITLPNNIFIQKMIKSKSDLEE